MDLLCSNFPPVRTDFKTFSDVFYSLLPETTQLDIAVGYITSDSIIELQKIMEFNKIKKLNLIIGMHYFDLFTKLEYNATLRLNDFLMSKERGEVRLVIPFRYHGKLYSYSNDKEAFAGIIGSNNLSSIIESGSRIYENSILLDDKIVVKKIKNFIHELADSATSNIADVNIDKFKEVNPLLDGHEFVKKVSKRDVEEIQSLCTSISFEIPIKTFEKSPHSNLNVFFGKGRESRNGLIKPRHWYEVELIVPKTITSKPGYPQAKCSNSIFTVITDDGWSFKCKVSGDYSKNFRSEGDLKILGKWLKGRLENAGVLTIGDPVTEETLRNYGRNTFSLTKTKELGIWFLDFGV